ncbi:SRPBCC family protein [Nonomuraea sp. NPDC002799]
MGHHWEQRDEATVGASVEEVWEAIATGPGLDSWFMGRNEVDPGPDGAVRTSMGSFTMDSAVTGWEPPHRFAHRGTDGPDGRFIAYEYIIEGRDQGSTVVRLVSNGFLPGDDWETEFEAMSLGGAMYFATLVAYLDHFAGRAGHSINVSGPPVTDWPATWSGLHRALGLTDSPRVGDPARITVPGLPAIEGVVDFVNAQALGIRAPDALYRFIQGYFGSIVLGHHFFRQDDTDTAQAWRAWLDGLPA